MNDSIRINGIKGCGYHGVFAEETKNGQDFLVDVELILDLEKATKSDDFVVRRSAPNYDLSVLLAGVRPGNRPEEIATGPALGKEVWWYQRPLVSRL